MPSFRIVRRSTRGVLARAALAATIALPLPAPAQTDKPQYGGTLTIGGYYLTVAPMSRDPAAWAWMFQHQNGLVYEQLFEADLDKSKRKGGKYSFIADAWFPGDSITGELAESWAWKEDPLRVEVKLRKGVMFPDKPGVMKSRELVAQDVVDTFEVLDRSPKRVATYFDHIAKVEATDTHTVVFRMKNYNAEWDYRFGWGLYCGIVPREVIAAGASDWKNANGTGPFQLADTGQGNTSTFAKNPIYWGRERIDGQSYALPFVDKIVYPTIKDESTFLSALRAGKLDILENIRWSAAEDLKKTAPQLIFNRFLSTGGQLLLMRVDTKPFDDIRVRRALNMAVDKREIVQSYYGGNAELLAFPIHPDFHGYHEPLERMPPTARELFTYDPARARKLLAEAGYPDGFRFTVQVCTCNQNHTELVPLIAAYLEKVGVKIDIQMMDYSAYLSSMLSRKHGAGAMFFIASRSPTTALRMNFGTGQTYNFAQYSDPEFDQRVAQLMSERDESKRQELAIQMTRGLIEKAPFIWLPVPYAYTAWWPWVKNYGGELRAGAERPGPIHARVWIDQELKKKMGY